MRKTVSADVLWIEGLVPGSLLVNKHVNSNTFLIVSVDCDRSFTALVTYGNTFQIRSSKEDVNRSFFFENWVRL